MSSTKKGITPLVNAYFVSVNRALKTGQLYLPRGIKRHVDTRINLSAAGHASREGVKKSLHFPIGN